MAEPRTRPSRAHAEHREAAFRLAGARPAPVADTTYPPPPAREEAPIATAPAPGAPWRSRGRWLALAALVFAVVFLLASTALAQDGAPELTTLDVVDRNATPAIGGAVGSILTLAGPRLLAAAHPSIVTVTEAVRDCWLATLRTLETLLGGRLPRGLSVRVEHGPGEDTTPRGPTGRVSGPPTRTEP